MTFPFSFWRNSAFPLTWANNPTVLSYFNIEQDGRKVTAIGGANYSWAARNIWSMEAHAVDFEFSFILKDHSHMIGLSDNTNNANSYSDIDYAIQFDPSGTLYWWENGGLGINIGTFATGDLFTFKRIGGVIDLFKNGVNIYTSAQNAAGRSLKIKMSIYAIDENPGMTVVKFA